jgi:LDH2 family malate/lactate/ureidoglycolate dehydrogenase
VLVPGDREFRNARAAQTAGVPLLAPVYKALCRLGDSVAVAPPPKHN